MVGGWILGVRFWTLWLGFELGHCGWDSGFWVELRWLISGLRGWGLNSGSWVVDSGVGVGLRWLGIVLWGSGIVDASQGFWVELKWLGFGLGDWVLFFSQLLKNSMTEWKCQCHLDFLKVYTKKQ